VKIYPFIVLSAAIIAVSAIQYAVCSKPSPSPNQRAIQQLIIKAQIDQAYRLGVVSATSQLITRAQLEDQALRDRLIELAVAAQDQALKASP
jgi:hypothetical protein